MKRSSGFSGKHLLISFLASFIIISGCLKKSENPVKYESGFFPDTVMNMGSINSAFDDYNLNINVLTGRGPIVFSSNRNSTGGQFDLVQGIIEFGFDQSDGSFELTTSILNDPFLDALINRAVTPRNDFGPYRFFNSADGYEYMVLSSENNEGKLDMYFLRNRPQFTQSIPEIEGPTPASVFNSGTDDAYFCFDLNQDTAYFCSSRSGNFEIYLLPKPTNIEMDAWFIQNPAATVPVDSLMNPSNDKCPHVLNKIMVFTSDRPGGLGGYDLYYSVMKKGKWSSPVNFGPGINTSYNEYRPVLGWHEDFTNFFLMFSSDRPEGKGGYDLYFTGVEF
jgi:hypothetical protein